MTTEELILGHFDKMLTPEQETALQEALTGSAETRALYDQHSHLNALMVADAELLEPSSRLNESVVAAALVALPEVIGGGAALWFSGKFVASVAAVVIGGGSVYFATRGPAPEPVGVPKSPVVRHMDLKLIPLPLPSFDNLEVEAADVVDDNVPATTSAPARSTTAKPSTTVRSTADRATPGTRASAKTPEPKFKLMDARQGGADARMNKAEKKK